MFKKSIIMVTIFLAIFMSGQAFSEDLVMFDYQGYVKVQGHAYTGVGLFKFAITNNSGNATLWSNDGTSVIGNEPTASISAQVTDGIFNILIGDPSLGMVPINRSIFNYPEKIKFRIWFNDGTHGFQHLTPDRHIVNPTLLGVRTGEEDFTIYVNGTTGSDNNNGLTTGTAKMTIQAAVNMLPQLLRCNVTVKVAPGIYREQVDVESITVSEGKFLTFLGDEAWTPASTGDPNVRITGADDDGTHVKVREYAFISRNSRTIIIKGFLCDYTSNSGIYIDNGMCKILNCKTMNNNYGIGIYFYARVLECTDCVSNNNVLYGFHIAIDAWATLKRCVAKYNGMNAIRIDAMGKANFLETGDFSNNIEDGIRVVNSSWAIFRYPGYAGNIKDNGGYGLYIALDSMTYGDIQNTITGNPLGSIHTETGGNAYNTP